MTRRILDYGDRAILVEVDSLDEVLALHRALIASRRAGVVDLVPAARTVAVLIDPSTIPLSVARKWVIGVEAPPVRLLDGEPVSIEVDYSGDDLGEVARLLGLTQSEVVAAHTAVRWRVAFCGFTPGFGYLVTESNPLVVPRRSAPRQSVPAGSVALAGEFSGVYPRSTPGGWQLIGRTDAELWDSTAPQPALLAPGVSVTFRSV